MARDKDVHTPRGCDYHHKQRSLRLNAEAAIERLIAFIDDLDGDADTEDDSDSEPDVDDEPAGDEEEPSLGSFDRLANQDHGWRQTAGPNWTSHLNGDQEDDGAG